jgi:hypothetical protein
MTHYGRLLRCSSIASNNTKLHNIGFLSVSWSVLIMGKRKTEKVREREPVYKLLVELVLETFRYKGNCCFFLHFMDEVVVSFHDL